MKLQQQITSYLNKKSTDYAIMFTGKWGCGKTYFIEKLEKNSKQTYIYYSLNGATNASEVINSIYLELFTSGKYNEVLTQGRKITSAVSNFLKEKTGKEKLFIDISSSVMAYCLNSAVEKELQEKSNNIVVILDDLERISDMLDITSRTAPLKEKTLSSIPWGHHMIIIDKCKNNAAKARFFVNKTLSIRF